MTLRARAVLRRCRPRSSRVPRCPRAGPPTHSRAVPDDVVQRARAALARTDPEATLAVEVDDSVLTDVVTTGPRRLRFSDGRLVVQLLADPRGDELDLEVRLSPPAVMTVEMWHPGGVLSGCSDPDGRCALTPVCRGAACLLVTDARSRTQTAWMLL